MKLYIAHAGIHLGSTAATQNSLRSIALAQAAGFDFCELDIWLTSDGVPVAVHNPTLNATYCTANEYTVPDAPVSVTEHTAAYLREHYIGRASDPAHRKVIPLLSECLALAKSLGIVPMIHPKSYDDASVDVIMDVCDAVMGAHNYYIVAENAACAHALQRDPMQPIMPVITDIAGIDYWTSFPNVIIAIRRAQDYAELTACTHQKNYPIETTLNDDIRASLTADVINYDYLSPGRFERYENITDYRLPAQTMKAGDTLQLTDNRTVSYGTAEISFTFCGDGVLEVCGRRFQLKADVPTAYRAPVLVSERIADAMLCAASDAEVSEIHMRVGEHPVRL